MVNTDNKSKIQEILKQIDDAALPDCAVRLLQRILQHCGHEGPCSTSGSDPAEGVKQEPKTRLLKLPDGNVIRHCYPKTPGWVTDRFQEKYQRFLALLPKNMTPSEIAKELDMSISTVYFWLRRIAVK